MARPRRLLPSEVPGYQQVALGVTEEDVDLPPPGEPRLPAVLREVPFEWAFVEWAFAWTARIDAQVRNGRRNRSG